VEQENPFTYLVILWATGNTQVAGDGQYFQLADMHHHTLLWIGL